MSRAETPAFASLLSLVAAWMQTRRSMSSATSVKIGAVIDVTRLPGESGSAALDWRALIGTQATSDSSGSSWCFSR